MINALTPHCIVEINGRRFDSWRDEIISSSVDLTTDKSSEAIIELFDPNFGIIDSFGGKTANAQFWYGWGADLNLPVFAGALARLEWNNKIAQISFHDHSTKMKREKKVRYHKKKTDLQILKDLANENGLNFERNSRLRESEPFDSFVQAGKTDWEFAKKIAVRAGLRLFVRGNTLYAVESGTTELNPPAATLNFGQDFQILRGFSLTFKLPNDKRSKRSKTEMRGRAKGAKQLKGKAQIGNSETTDIIVHEDLPMHTITIANQRAASKPTRQREYAFEHVLRTLSSFRQKIDVRQTITLAGMGKFFSGNYIVTQIRHDFRPGQLISELRVGGDLK